MATVRLTCTCGWQTSMEEHLASLVAKCPSCGKPFPQPTRAESVAAAVAVAAPAHSAAAVPGNRAPAPAAAPRPAAAPPPAPAAAPATSPTSGATSGTASGGGRRAILEVILDPRSIHWLLVIGGCLMVLGLVIWLASVGFFKDPLKLALTLGVANLALLAAGCGIVLKTRYRMAGQALALMACVLLPMNLWFYHAQNLVTLEGHLWVAGLFCCVLFALTAFILRDWVFVYAAQTGVLLTGVLLLADLGVATQMPMLAFFLVALGLISIHCERGFPVNDGPFARERFGMACFWSGQFQLGLGLLVLFTAQILQLLRWPGGTFIGYQWGGLSSAAFPLLPLSLWLVGAYAYLYSDLFIRRVGVYTFLAAFCLLMAETTAVSWRFHNGEALIALFAGTALAANFARAYLSAGHDKLRRALPPVGLVLMALPLLLGTALHYRATSAWLGAAAPQWAYVTTWWFVAAMVFLAAASRISARLLRDDHYAWSAAYLFLTAAACLLGLAGGLRLLQLADWHRQAPILMIVPLAYLAAARFYRGRPAERPLVWVGQAATAVMVLSVVIGSVRAADLFVRQSPENGFFAVFFALAACFYIAAALLRGRGANIYLAALMAAGAAWQVIALVNLPEAWYAVVYAALGLILLIAYRLLSSNLEKPSSVSVHLFQCANSVLMIACLAALLQGLTRLAGRQITNLDLAAVASTLGVCVLACLLVRSLPWRRAYLVACVALGGVCFLMINVLSTLSTGQKLEVFSVVVGLAMLIVSLLTDLRGARSRMAQLAGLEQAQSLAGAGLWLGSLLAVVPLLIATCAHRFSSMPTVSTWDEFPLLTLAVAMLVIGYVLQFKAPTLIGGLSLVLHLILVVVFVGRMAQVAIGVYLAAGGGAVFGTGVLLAVYREKLLAMPQQIANRQGVFRVFGWR